MKTMCLSYRDKITDLNKVHVPHVGEGVNLRSRALEELQGLFLVADRDVSVHGFHYLGCISEIHSRTLHESHEGVVEINRRAKILTWLSTKEASVDE